jgi:flavin-dependent dehydrogenase
MISESRDAIVIGGGPAGSTFAATLRKYAPHLAVTVLEQARFPRYHIGESTIPVANAVLRDLDVYDALERSGAVKKIGIVFVWGEDRTPWNADYLRLREVPGSGGREGAPGHVIDVTGQDFERMFGDHRGRETPFTAFNVRRADFDALLLDRAKDRGAEVRQGTRATEVLRGASGAVEGLRWEDDAGRTGAITAPFVLDASGLSSLLTRGDRERDPHMNNFAVYGYLKGARWKVTFNGTQARTTVFIAAVERGWIWYFPIGDDIMSVGAVTHRDHFRDRLRDVDLETFWWDMLRSCPEISELVEGATLRTDVLPDGKRVAASRDWSSWARRPVGEGWAAAGDAAAFVDPILSSGVTLALQSGHRAACTFNTARARPGLPAADLWRAYADYIRGEAASFLTLARHFYGDDRAAPSWWGASRGLVNRSGRLALDDLQAFTMATAGFFPTPRALSADVVGALINNLARPEGDVLDIFRERGVPPPEEIDRSSFEVVTPFRLSLRAEPSPEAAARGELETYHDLVPDEMAFAHRLNAVPCRIPPTLAPLVAALPRYRSVAALLADAPRLVGPGVAPDETLRRNARDVLCNAVLKGFVRLIRGEENSTQRRRDAETQREGERR